MSKPIYIYGAGGLGREIKAMIGEMNEWNLAGFYDDGIDEGTYVEGTICLGGVEKLNSVESPLFLILAIGNPTVKLQLIDKVKDHLFITFPSIIHPSAILLNKPNILISHGCIITAGCVLTTNIKLGKHTLINLNSTIGHDTVIGDASSIMPSVNIAGEVMIGKGVLIGSGANVLNGLHIGDGSRVGAGAVVTKNVNPGTTVVGVPAK